MLFALFHSIGSFMSRFIFIFIFFAGWAHQSFALVVEFVVKPDGNQENHKPLSCLCVGRGLCEVYLNQLDTELSADCWKARRHEKVEKVIVQFLPGNYIFGTPLQLSWGKGSTENIPLVIRGAGTSTVLTGAQPINRWVRPNANQVSQLSPNAVSQVRVSDVSFLPIDFIRPIHPSGFGLPILPVLAAVYQNDRELTLARWPNDGYAAIERVTDSESKEKRLFRILGHSRSSWKKELELMANGFWFHDWAAQQYRVSVGVDGTLSISGDGSYFGIRDGQRVFVVNALSELDEQGEWYLNRATGELFAWLFDESLPVEIAIAETIFKIENSRNILISDLIIEKVRGDAVRISKGDDVVLDNVSIRHTGNRALVIIGGRKSGIRNSLIEHNGEGGVFLSGGDRLTLNPSEHFVEKSTIRDFSRIARTYRFAVEMRGVGQRVIGNVISDAPHSAIYFVGNNHLIGGNEIFNVVRETSDAGAIYVGRDFTARGTVIEDNFLHDIRPADKNFEVKGIYLDDQASGIIVRNNIFARVQKPVFIGGGRDNSVLNNIFYESSPGVHLDARGLGWQKADTLARDGTLQSSLDQMPIKSSIWQINYPRLSNIRNDDFGAPKYNLACGNVVVGGVPHNIEKLAISGIHLEGFVLGDEEIFVELLTSNGRRNRTDFVLKEEVEYACRARTHE